LLVGASPRQKGMLRSDLIKKNGPIFVEQGKAINDNASRTARVLVVGNPCNTNCLIASSHAPDMPHGSFTAMSRLDLNRGINQLIEKLGGVIGNVDNLAIWGNHSATMFPDVSNTTWKGKSVN